MSPIIAAVFAIARSRLHPTCTRQRPSPRAPEQPAARQSVRSAPHAGESRPSVCAVLMRPRRWASRARHATRMMAPTARLLVAAAMIATASGDKRPDEQRRPGCGVPPRADTSHTMPTGISSRPTNARPRWLRPTGSRRPDRNGRAGTATAWRSRGARSRVRYGRTATSSLE